MQADGSLNLATESFGPKNWQLLMKRAQIRHIGHCGGCGIFRDMLRRGTRTLPVKHILLYNTSCAYWGEHHTFELRHSNVAKALLFSSYKFVFTLLTCKKRRITRLAKQRIKCSTADH